MIDTLVAARTAFARHDWAETLDALHEAEETGPLPPADLMLLGDAYWWTGQPDEAIAAIERAFSGFVEEDSVSEAATAGSLLAYFAMRKQSYAIAGGWIARVERILSGQEDSVGSAYLAILHTAKALFADRDWEAAIGLADAAGQVAVKVGAPYLRSLAMSFKGIAMVQIGDWRGGLALIDESAAGAMSQGGDLRTASDVYCNTIAACRNLGDYRRASEWTDAAERWMQMNSVTGYTGVCKVHRAELKRLNGSWPEAEQEARKACVELERFHIIDGIGFAYYEIGEVRRRMGDLVAAEEAFNRAFEYGHNAQPGLALLLRDSGDVNGAASAIAAALGGTQSLVSIDEMASPARGRLLPAQVEIALAAGDIDTARSATEELERIAESFDAKVWAAYAMTCRGSLHLHEGNVADAIRVLDQAWRLWQQIDMPYEAARTRVLSARAKSESGDSMGARLEVKAARSTFEQLGAATDLRNLEEVMEGGVPGAGSAKGSRTDKVFMFTDIVTSTDLIGLIGDDAWQDLLAWHDRSLRAAISAAGGEEVAHTGDGFFVAFDGVRSAIDCAVDIQRKLSEHRHVSGFAPRVRIGVHAAEATRRANNYSGQGVHAAARVGALASGEEILVSVHALEQAGRIPYPVSEPRRVELKGINEPMDVVSLDWK